jgi:hypothetical protein
MVDLARNSKTLGLDQVEFSHTTELECMEIYDDSEIYINMRCDIGNNPAYEKHIAFEQKLPQLSTNTPPP